MMYCTIKCPIRPEFSSGTGHSQSHSSNLRAMNQLRLNQICPLFSIYVNWSVAPACPAPCSHRYSPGVTIGPHRNIKALTPFIIVSKTHSYYWSGLLLRTLKNALRSVPVKLTTNCGASITVTAAPRILLPDNISPPDLLQGMPLGQGYLHDCRNVNQAHVQTKSLPFVKSYPSGQTNMIMSIRCLYGKVVQGAVVNSKCPGRKLDVVSLMQGS